MTRKEEILVLTDQLVKSVGYESFSYADLSEQLGITKASIHHHFPRKEDLGTALCASYAENLSKTIAGLEQGDGGAWGRIEKYLMAGAALVEDHGKNCPIASLQSQVNTLPDSMKARLRELNELELGFFTRMLEAGRTSGELTFKGDAQSQAAVILCAYKGALAYARVQGCQFFKDAVAQLKKLVGV